MQPRWRAGRRRGRGDGPGRMDSRRDRGDAGGRVGLRSAVREAATRRLGDQSKRGGGLIPQDLVNLGRDFTHNFKSAYNALNGYPSPVDPAPYKGQLTGALNNNRFML